MYKLLQLINIIIRGEDTHVGFHRLQNQEGEAGGWEFLKKQSKKTRKLWRVPVHYIEKQNQYIVSHK